MRFFRIFSRLGVVVWLMAGANLGVGQVAEATPPPAGKLTISHPIGSPDNLKKIFSRHLTARLKKFKIPVAQAGESSAYRMKTYFYCPSAPEATAKIVYLVEIASVERRWHSGSGEIALPKPATKDPWDAVSPQTMRILADRVADEVRAWHSAMQKDTSKINH